MVSRCSRLRQSITYLRNFVKQVSELGLDIPQWGEELLFDVPLEKANGSTRDLIKRRDEKIAQSRRDSELDQEIGAMLLKLNWRNLSLGDESTDSISEDICRELWLKIISRAVARSLSELNILIGEAEMLKVLTNGTLCVNPSSRSC
jgi:hypothetical protein